MNSITQNRNARPINVVLVGIACLMSAVGVIACAVPIMAPMRVAGFGHSMMIMKVHPMVAPTGALLLVGSVAVWFYATRMLRRH